MVLILIPYKGIYIAPLGLKSSNLGTDIPIFSGFMIKWMVVGVLLVGVLVC